MPDPLNVWRAKKARCDRNLPLLRLSILTNNAAAWRESQSTAGADRARAFAMKAEAVMDALLDERDRARELLEAVEGWNQDDANAFASAAVVAAARELRAARERSEAVSAPEVRST